MSYNPSSSPDRTRRLSGSSPTSSSNSTGTPPIPTSPGFRQPTASASGLATSPKPLSGAGSGRKGSIADILATPPPIQSSSSSASGSNLSLHVLKSTSTGGSTPASPSNSNLLSPHNIEVESLQWQDVPLSQLVQKESLVFVSNETPVESAFETLVSHNFTSLPIKVSPRDLSVSHTFDYADLNAYLLLVLGHNNHTRLLTPADEDYLTRARNGQPVPVKFAASIQAKDPFMSLKDTHTISEAIDILASGVHRVAVTDSKHQDEVVGILSQRRLVRFIWENGRRFKSLEATFQSTLSELGISGNHHVIAIPGDALVIDALIKMRDENISSLAVVDASYNLLGNISIVDVKHVTKSSSSPLLRSTCLHFLSVILNSRGLRDGKDSFPVFHVTRKTTFGRTVAKLVATQSHRLWIVQDDSELNYQGSIQKSNQNSCAAAGKLIGVLSLTDILNVLATVAGKTLDPHSARRQRRSSSSVSRESVKKHLESLRQP
ncbi:CBS-domain-containing protein [Nadsonia fulvescens var. elongata DSM 6958]|uniref:CBS-domain-containing protein n=1 Tax=Nadsonia fulvescens var. elongata DSM 6958 TaxID=857566 RepID=A0A1E3PRR5_9ASCO|nr:CBS-domain-containing protein [Nadsonia fulvescens var. elongata DSM 6958]